eukprot:8525281-Alexandrium_andersonii.AAC.1
MLDVLVPIDPDPGRPYGMGIVLTGLSRSPDLNTGEAGYCDLDSPYFCNYVRRIVGGNPLATLTGLMEAHEEVLTDFEHQRSNWRNHPAAMLLIVLNETVGRALVAACKG